MIFISSQGLCGELPGQLQIGLSRAGIMQVGGRQVGMSRGQLGERLQAGGEPVLEPDLGGPLGNMRRQDGERYRDRCRVCRGNQELYRSSIRIAGPRRKYP
jgi:hypothetical protein